MKNKTLGFAFVALLFFGAFASPVIASDYLGEFCFRAIASDKSTRLLKLGVSDMGGQHYQIAGSWIWEDGRRSAAPVNGNVEIIDNTLQSTFTFIFYDSDFIYYRINHMELDPSSLAGTINQVKYKRSKTSNTGSHGKSIMPVSFTSCP